jgi:hypothetical protein
LQLQELHSAVRTFFSLAQFFYGDYIPSTVFVPIFFLVLAVLAQPFGSAFLITMSETIKRMESLFCIISAQAMPAT